MKTTPVPMKTLLLASLVAVATLPWPAHAVTLPEGYTQVNLVADEPGVAARTDPDLVNPWGLIAGPASIYVNLTETSLTKTYTPGGSPFAFKVHFPGPGAIEDGSPTGIVFNETKSFRLTNGVRRAAATFLMAGEGGNIAAWNSFVNGPKNATNVIDQSSAGAVYKGLAIGFDTNGAPRLYAANFRLGRVDVFDAQFNLIGVFSDPNIPGGFAPFNVRTIRGRLFVTFAKQGPGGFDDDPGTGNGYVDIFDMDGNLLRRFASNGVLDSPWGMTIAPRNFGRFSGALLVGNFGDGRINGFDLLTGQWLGALSTTAGEPIEIEGLWGLDFEQREIAGNECGFNANRLYFTAGPGDEEHGLLGYIKAVNPPPRGRFPFAQQ
jgi:uncharacterized protein (TIGR03118 family)